MHQDVRATRRESIEDSRSSSFSGAAATSGRPGTMNNYRWPFVGLVSFIFIGATGNILVCAAVWRERRLQTATNYFLLSLAVADLLVCTLVMPFGIIYEFYGQWPFNWHICNLWVTWDVLTCSSSILHMCFISVGRYIGIRNPLHARQTNLFVSRRAVLWRIALAWISAALIASPLTMMSLYDHRNIVPSETECAISNKYFLIFGSMLAFFIPMFVMVWSYIMTVRLLSRRAKYVHNSGLLLTGSGNSSSQAGLMLDGGQSNNNNNNNKMEADSRGITLRRSSGGYGGGGGPINSPSYSLQLNLLSSSSSLMQFKSKIRSRSIKRRGADGSCSRSSSGGPDGGGEGGAGSGNITIEDKHFIVPASWKHSKVVLSSQQPQSQPGAPTAARETSSRPADAATNNDDDDGIGGGRGRGCVTGSGGKPLPWLEENSHDRDGWNARRKRQRKGRRRQSATKVADLFASAPTGACNADYGARTVIGPNRFELTAARTKVAPLTINSANKTGWNQRHDEDNLDKGQQLSLLPEMSLGGQILSATRFIDDEDGDNHHRHDDDDDESNHQQLSLGYLYSLCQPISSNGPPRTVALNAGLKIEANRSNLSIVSQRVMEGAGASKPLDGSLLLTMDGGGRLKCHHRVNHAHDDMLPSSLRCHHHHHGRRCLEKVVSDGAQVAGEPPAAAADSRQPPEAVKWKSELLERQSRNIRAGRVDRLSLAPPPPTSSNLSLATCCRRSFNQNHQQNCLNDREGQQMTRKFSHSTSLLPDETCFGRFNLKSAACQQKRFCFDNNNDEGSVCQYPMINITPSDSLKLDCTRMQQTILGRSTTSGSKNSRCCRKVANPRELKISGNFTGEEHANMVQNFQNGDDHDYGHCNCKRRQKTAARLAATHVSSSNHLDGNETYNHCHHGHKHHHHHHRHRRHHHHHHHHHHHRKHHYHRHHKHHHHHGCKHHKQQHPKRSDGVQQLDLDGQKQQQQQHDKTGEKEQYKSEPETGRIVDEGKQQQHRHLSSGKQGSGQNPHIHHVKKLDEDDEDYDLQMEREIDEGACRSPPVVACNGSRLASFGSSIMLAAMAALPAVLSSAVVPRGRRSTLANFGTKASLTTSGSNTTAVSGGSLQQGATAITSGVPIAQAGSGLQQQQDNNNNNNNSSNNNYNDNEPQMIRYLGSSMQVRSEQKATKVLGVVFFTFVICWSPFFVINFTQAFVERKQLAKWISNEMMTTFLWLGYISSTINPVIYTIFNRNFRNAFRQILLCQPPSNQFGSLHQSRASEMNRAAFRISQTKNNRANSQNQSLLNGPTSQDQNRASFSETRPATMGFRQPLPVHHRREISNSMSLDGGGGSRKGLSGRPLMVAANNDYRTNNQVHQSRDADVECQAGGVELQQINQALLVDETIPEELNVLISTSGDGKSGTKLPHNTNDQQPTTGAMAAQNWTGNRKMAWALKSALKSSSDLITSLSGTAAAAGNRQSAEPLEDDTGGQSTKRTRFQY